MRPIPLILTGYGAAGVVGAGLWFTTASVVAALLAVWIGGAALTLALAAAPATRRVFSRAETIDDHGEAMLAEAMRLWERDRFSDARDAAPDEDVRVAQR